MPQAVVVSDDEALNFFDQKNGALAMGNDVHVTECALQEAAHKCLTLDAAVGFTFAPTAALPGGRYRCYFKSSKKKNSDPLWQTYCRSPRHRRPWWHQWCKILTRYLRYRETVSPLWRAWARRQALSTAQEARHLHGVWRHRAPLQQPHLPEIRAECAPLLASRM